MTYCLKRKNKKRFFSFQSMPNLNFAELIPLSYYKATESFLYFDDVLSNFASFSLFS